MNERYVTDTSLDETARRLRFLGYDVETLDGARLEDLFAHARAHGRTVLTLSSRHPRRFADVEAIRLPREDPARAVRMIRARAEPAGAPFSRCPRCNTALQKRLAMEAQGEVPGRVLRSAKALFYCPHCGQWFWHGSHVDRMRAWLARATGTPVEWPHG